MSTSTPRSPAEQKAWTEGFNTGVAMAIKSLRQTMLPDGPTLDDIDRALGLPSPALPAARSDGQTIGEFYGDPGARCSADTADVIARLRELHVTAPNEKLAKVVTAGADEIERLRAALDRIIAANNDFRAGLPDDWEGDPLQDAIEEAEKWLPDLPQREQDTKGDLCDGK